MICDHFDTNNCPHTFTDLAAILIYEKYLSRSVGELYVFPSFKVRTAHEQSFRIQELLFSVGGRWIGGSRQVTDMLYLSNRNPTHLFYPNLSWANGVNHFRSRSEPEYDAH